MSYDLCLYCPNKEITRQEFLDFFAKRKHCSVWNQNNDLIELGYENKNSGVSFMFVHDFDSTQQDLEKRYRIIFTIPSVRLHYFAIEAANELAAFVEHFNCIVEDPQIEPMPSFSKENFITSWNKYNRLCIYHANNITSDSTNKLSYIDKKITEQIWLWNYHRDEVSEKEDVFIPTVFLGIMPEVGLVTYIVWTDIMPIAIPSFIDYIVVHKEELIKDQPDDVEEAQEVPEEVTYEDRLVRYKDLEQTLAEYPLKKTEFGISFYSIDSYEKILNPILAAFFLKESSLPLEGLQTPEEDSFVDEQVE